MNLGGAAYRIDNKALEATKTNISSMCRGTPGLKMKMGWSTSGHKPYSKYKTIVHKRDFECTLNAAHLTKTEVSSCSSSS